MTPRLIACVALGLLTAPAPARAATPGPARVTALRVEYLTNPVGIDQLRPRFSWIVESSERGTRQTAYQVLVASSPQRLAKGEGDLWDSGKVSSADNAQIAYDGSELFARERYHFTVRVWDDKGRELRAAEPGFFEMGILDFATWRGRFIGIAPAGVEDRMPFVGGKWIWAPEPRPSARPQRLVLRGGFALAPGEQVRWAELVVAAAASAGPGAPPVAPGRIWINGSPLRDFGAPVSDPRWLPVPADRLAPGDNEVAFDLPYSPRGALVVGLRLELADGSVRVVHSDERWRQRLFEREVADSAADPAWRGARFAEDWAAVEVRGAFGETIDMQEPGFRRIDKVVPPIYLRKAFALTKPVARARLYATAAGVYEAYVNGKRVGGDPLAPGLTDYARRLRYQTYDVTALLAPGANALAAIVGDGWYTGRTGLGQNVWGYDKAFLAELHVDYKDGSHAVIVSDESWRGATGPERRADLLDGVVYDARREQSGWNEARFADAKWAPAILLTPRVGRFEAPAEPPVRAVAVIPARAVTSPAPGVQIFDLGQDVVGRARVKLTAPAGAVMVLRHGEVLDLGGTLFVDNLGSANATDRFVARGGPATFEPRFTLHGFRYIEVSGLPAPLPLAAVSGVVIASDLPAAGRLQTSSPLCDRLHASFVWAARGSFVASPMVAPQGDQRLGWGAEVAGFARTAAFTFDVAAFLGKYAQDLLDGQLADGRFPDAAPGARQGSAGTPGWADAGVMVPALLHELYGDTRVLERQYDGMKRWVDARARAPRVTDPRPLGDPGARGPQPSLALVAQAYQVASARLLARAAATLGKTDDAARYGALAEQGAAAFLAAFATPDGGLASDSATAYALALGLGLLPEPARAAALARLVAALERALRHAPTGVIGTAQLLPALGAGGRAELAAALLLGEGAPSWLAAVKAGATTPWERWDALGPDGPNRSAPAAYNHLALASVGAWLYTGLAGLDFDRSAPAWSRIVLRPLIGAGGLTRVRGEHTSVRGKVVCDWHLGSDGLTLEVEVPVHATALLHVPAASGDAIKENGRPLAGSAGVRVAETRDGVVVLELGSGRYRFTVPRP